MLPFRRILFPVDFSRACHAVVPWVRDAVTNTNGELTLLHATGTTVYDISGMMLVDPSWAGELQTLGEKRLREFAASEFPGLNPGLQVRGGEPAAMIHEAVKHGGFDLVMMPTTGLGPVRRLLMGSITTKVLHDVSAAVWTGTGLVLMDHHPKVPYRSILCAIEDGEEAESVVKAADTLAKSYGASLSLCHVMELPTPVQISSDSWYEPYRAQRLNLAENRIRELKSRLNVEAPHSLLEGDIADAIRAEAAEKSADLIIVGRGWAQGAVSRLWSRLYPIVCQAPCPVLSI